MTIRYIVEQALKRLGYTGTNGNEQLSRRLMNKALEIVNDVYFDLWEKAGLTEVFTAASSLDDQVYLPYKALRVMVYGVAAFMAQSENDGDQQQLWIAMYNNKRVGLSKTAQREDVLPFTDGA